MDLDEMMSKVEVLSNNEAGADEALSLYVDVLNEYGDNSPEEQKMYSVITSKFTGLDLSCDETKKLKAAYDNGKNPLLPKDFEMVESALQKSGFKKE